MSNKLAPVAEVIRRYGWTQFVYIDAQTGARCLAGAIMDVTGTFSPTNSAYWELRHEVTRRVGDDSLGVVGWNDAPGRTADEVLELLDREDVPSE